jgi:hypothetical protein
MPLVTQAEYARRVGASRQAIHRRVVEGIIPTHGAKRLIDLAEAAARYVPRIDAGLPQLRVGGPAADAVVAAAAWLARSLEVDERRTQALLAGDLEAQLVRVRLVAV